MVERANSGSERTFNQSAAKVRNEPALPIYYAAANVCFWYCWQNCVGMFELVKSFKFFETNLRRQLFVRRAIAS